MNTHNSVYSPLWLNDDVNLPKDRATINAWCRSFFALNPDVNRIISQHAILILKYMSIKSVDASDSVDSFFKNMNRNMNLNSILESVIVEYLLLGEAFVYAHLDQSLGSWSKLAIQNPDYIVVKRKSTIPSDEIYLRPDENLRRIVQSDKPEDKFQASLLNAKIVEDIKAGNNIQLDNFHVTHFSRRVSPYEIRGTSVLNSLFRLLHKGEHTPEETATIKSTLWDIESSNAIAKDVIVQRYLHIHEMLSNWLENKIFQPISKINSFYEIKGASKELMYPKVTFDTAQLIRDIKA